MGRKVAFRTIVVSLPAWFCVACATLPAPTHRQHPIDPATFGATREAAVEVCMPAGEREYLSALSCPNGKTPDFSRIGSFGTRNVPPAGLSEAELNALLGDLGGRKALRPGEVDYHIVDGYQLTCGPTLHVIYLDMYHCDKPATTVAPAGFRFRHEP